MVLGIDRILCAEKGAARQLIIKIFKISTQEMWKFKNKNALREFVMENILCIPSKHATIKELISYLPVEEYYRVK